MAAAIDIEKEFGGPAGKAQKADAPVSPMQRTLLSAEDGVGHAAKRPRRDFGLTPSEVEDLRLFFDGAEGMFGVRSSQGALEDELCRRCPSDGARDDTAREHRLRAVRRRRPKKPAFAAGFASVYAAFGLRAPAYRDDDDEKPLWADEHVSGSDGHAYAGFAGEIDLDAAGRMSHVRARLVLLGPNWTGVLYAAHGPRAAQWAKDGRGNPTHPATWFGSHLVEIAVALLAFENYQAGEERVDARAQVWSFASGGPRAIELRNEAREKANEAAAAYRLTRCPFPCRRCWPA